MDARQQKTKIVFRRGRPLTKIVLLITIILCSVALLTIGGAIRAEQARLKANKAAAFAAEQEKDNLQDKIDRLGSQESIEEMNYHWYTMEAACEEIYSKIQAQVNNDYKYMKVSVFCSDARHFPV